MQKHRKNCENCPTPYKFPGKSSLNVRSVCPGFPGFPVCPDDHDDHDEHDYNDNHNHDNQLGSGFCQVDSAESNVRSYADSALSLLTTTTELWLPKLGIRRYHHSKLEFWTVSSPSSPRAKSFPVSAYLRIKREPQDVDDTCISWRFSQGICRADNQNRS